LLIRAGQRLGTIYLQIHFYQEVLTMAICVSRAMLENPSVCITLAEIEAALKEDARTAFRRFTTVITPPSGAPGCLHVVQVATQCLLAYQNSVGNEATEFLHEVATSVDALAEALKAVPLLPFSRSSMWRCLSRSPAWGLFIDVPVEEAPIHILEGVGAEICRCWPGGWRFTASLATNLRLAIRNGDDLEDTAAVPVKQLRSAIRDANTICVATALPQCPLDDPGRYAAEVKQWFRNRVFFSSDKAQQAVFHHRTQSHAQFLESARSLRERVEAGDNLATQICDGALLALRADLVGQTPLLNGSLSGDWLISVDVDTGCAHFTVTLFAEGGATPPTKAASGAIAPASTIYVTPLPAFLAEAHRRQQAELPGANTLGALLPVTKPLAPRTSTLEQDARIAPSYAKLRNALGAFAVSIGIDRYIAAVLCKDPRLVPSGKFFYSRITREELWAAAAELYGAMGWGPPVPFVEGLAAGSQVTPTIETIRAWSDWMSNQVDLLRPTISPTLQQVIDFHNTYAKAIASLTSFSLALRARKVIPLTASSILWSGLTVAIGDKRCGMVPGPRSVPLPQFVCAALAAFLNHVEATDQLLGTLGVSPDQPLKQHFKQILNGENVPLFTTIARDRHKAIGASCLEEWWPSEYGLSGNHGRHYVQNNMRAKGVRSTNVDFYVRHMLRGITPSSTSSTKSLRRIAEAIVPALDSLLAEAGLTPMPGLSIS
jgi:hypothetical protein